MRCLGTEDRQSEKSKQIPSSQTVTAFVTFPGQDIKDLYVHEAAAPAAPPAPPLAAPALPTPPPQQTQRHQQEKSRGPPAKPQGAHAERVHPPAAPQTAAAPAAAPAPRQAVAPAQQHKAAPSNTHARSAADAPKDSKNRSEPRPAPASNVTPAASTGASAQRGIGTGEHLLHLRRKGFGTTDENSSAGEFDIVQALSAFNKEAVMASVAKDTNKDGDAVI